MDAASSAALDAWRRELSPWLNVLACKLVVDAPPLPSARDMARLWIALSNFDASDFTSARWTKILEALELLDLLVRVAPALGWRLVLELAAVNRAFEINYARSFPRETERPRYVVMIEDSEMRENASAVMTALERFVGAPYDLNIPPSRGFLELKRRLLDQWMAQHDGRELDHERDGRIDIKPSLAITTHLDDDFGDSLIHRLEYLAIANRLSSRRSSFEGVTFYEPNASPFHFPSIKLAFLEAPMTNLVMYGLLDTADRGLRISELDIDMVLLSELDYRLSLRFWAKVFSNSCSPETADGVKKLTITSGMFDEETIRIVCSGIAMSGSLEEVVSSSEGVRHEDRPIWWRWLAYALFSSSTTHHIQTAALDVQKLLLSEVEEISEVLRHPNPLAVAYAMSQTNSQRELQIGPATVAVLKRGTTLETGHLIVVSLDPAPIVRDNADEDFVELLLPKFNICRIKRSDIASIEPAAKRKGCGWFPRTHGGESRA